MDWTATYHRHGGKYTNELDTPKQAYDFLEGGADYGDLAPHSITSPSGRVYRYPYVSTRDEEERAQENWDILGKDRDPEDPTHINGQELLFEMEVASE